MALKMLRTVTCKVFSHGACECNPSALSTIQFCSSSSRTLSRRPKVAIGQSVGGVPLVVTPSLGSIRFMSSKSDPERNPGADSSATASLAGSVQSKLKELWKSYGVIAVGTYLGVYAGTLTGMFFALDYDIFNAATFGLDPAYAVQKFCDVFGTLSGSTTLPDYIRENPRVGTFAVAWVMTKFTEPLRLGATIAVVPTIARWLGRKKAEDAQK